MNEGESPFSAMLGCFLMTGVPWLLTLAEQARASEAFVYLDQLADQVGSQADLSGPLLDSWKTSQEVVKAEARPGR